MSSKDSLMSRIPLIEIYTINNAIIYHKHIIHLTVILSHFHLTWHWINKACMDKLTSYEMMLPMLMMLLQKVTGTRILDNSMECSRNNVFKKWQPGIEWAWEKCVLNMYISRPLRTSSRCNRSVLFFVNCTWCLVRWVPLSNAIIMKKL